MHADPDICTRQPGWYPGVNSLPDGFSHVPWICPPFELSQFCSRQAQISIYAFHQSSVSSSILHGALYPSIEFWQFSLDTRSGPLDCGASYPLGARIVRALHHSGWCTASTTILRSYLLHHLLIIRLLETTLEDQCPLHFTWLF